jgi:ferrous iron transport protein A
MSLADLPRGRSATIVELHAKTDPATARRLFDLGFVPGALVEMVRRAPLTDPVVFAVAGYEIALRRAQARLIDVTVTA